MNQEETKNVLRSALRDLRRTDSYRASMFTRWKWGAAKVHGTVAVVSNCAAGNRRVTIEVGSDGKAIIVY